MPRGSNHCANKSKTATLKSSASTSGALIGIPPGFAGSLIAWYSGVTLMPSSPPQAKPRYCRGFCDGYLRNHLGDHGIAVIGVALKGKSKEDDQAAILGIKQVPDTQVLYAGQGESGFLKACLMAVNSELPEIKLQKSRPVLT